MTDASVHVFLRDLLQLNWTHHRHYSRRSFSIPASPVEELYHRPKTHLHLKYLILGRYYQYFGYVYKRVEDIAVDSH